MIRRTIYILRRFSPGTPWSVVTSHYILAPDVHQQEEQVAYLRSEHETEIEAGLCRIVEDITDGKA